MNIRSFQPGDEASLATIYNQVAGDLPKFKPATSAEVSRRCREPGFDPQTRFFAEENGQVVGYATFNPSGRVSFPWCLKGFESIADQLFGKVISEMQARAIPKAFAAYRADWPKQNEFFLERTFEKARDMVNFVVEVVDLPTRPVKRSNPLTPLRQKDLSVLSQMAPRALRTSDRVELERHFFQNRYFNANAVFVLRSRADEIPMAFGILVTDQNYASPNQVDPAMPCFRLGAFGTEGMAVKRINGLFSFLTREGPDTTMLGLDLTAHAATLLEETGGGILAAQVSSDAPHLLTFYQRYFQHQGSFPVLERLL